MVSAPLWKAFHNEEAQVDFGFAGQLLDPERGRICRAWCL
jgi:hypothetical protein